MQHSTLRPTLRSTLIALTIAALPTIALPVIGTQTYADTRGNATTVTAQKAVNPKTPRSTPGRPVVLPAGITGTWNIDPQHSRIGFAVRHVVISDVHGSFNDFEGKIVVNEKEPAKSSVEFKAKVASIDTNVAQRDAHLKSPDFFDAEKYPEITFKSTRIERNGNGLRAIGTFTMHGVSKTIAIPFRVKGPVVDGFGATRAGVEANLDLNRQDYGVSYNQVLDNGGLMIDNVVRVDLDLEAVKAEPKPKPVQKK